LNSKEAKRLMISSFDKSSMVSMIDGKKGAIRSSSIDTLWILSTIAKSCFAQTSSPWVVS